ncbi:lipopolysaccharide heptosyltransferase I [Kistimonas scapharcae]|uniref:Lipopolysaccharide heptosyltransferase 1 n=1 Tax=Kistimonas scapharcae TaxID=1036133 RepID=A0ABP8V3Z1_9GAMM
MKALVIKTSSMGDVIHTLPALTDASEAIEGIRFDWIVEEGFSEIPAWHPVVDRIIPVAIRRWRKHPLSTWRNGEWRKFRETVDQTKYDIVIDAQGLLKSAWLTRYTHGSVHGLDKNSAREPMAARFYDTPHAVAKNQHAVERVRQLFAQSLGYEIPRHKGHFHLDSDYFIDIQGIRPIQQYMVFLHGTTWETKHWPEAYWCDLARHVTQSGYAVCLPWGNENERLRAERIATAVDGVRVLPQLNLRDIASVIAGASAVVAVDTGLGHLTAALEVPAVSLYGPTSPDLVGAYGENQVHLTLDQCPPSQTQNVEPPIFAPMTADIVWQQLKPIIRTPGKSATGKRLKGTTHESAGTR